MIFQLLLGIGKSCDFFAYFKNLKIKGMNEVDRQKNMRIKTKFIVKY